jgi:serine phosphatase RsbU (regulator of sigma subunit)
MSYPALDTLEVYQQIQGKWQRKLYSDNQKFDLRDYQYHNYIIPLHLPDTQVHSIYLRACNGGSLTVPMEVVEQKTFSEKIAVEEIGYGLYYGIMLAMVLYNLFIYFSLRDNSYIYYILSIISVSIFMGNVTGYTFQYMLPTVLWFQKSAATLGMLGWVASSAIFTITFLKSGQYTKTLTKILYTNLWIGLLGCLCNYLLPYSIMTRWGAAMVGFNAIIIFSTAIMNMVRGNKMAHYFTLAWSFLLASVFAIVLARIGILPSNFFTVHGVEIGSAVEVILLSFALSDRYKLIKRANEKLQREALRNQQIATENLEIKVQERTSELRETVEELNQINEELQSSVDVIKEQKRIIEKKNTDITASIQYAKRIQTAMLPLENNMREWLPEHFVFLKPRDIVSGDFYWAVERNGNIFLAVADCTGHGVPGALMSMVCSNLLNDIIVVKNVVHTDLILSQLRQNIIIALQQDTTNNRDGMDIAMTILDKKQRTVEFSGANNGLFYLKTTFQNTTSTFIKADKMTIGGMQIAEETFTRHLITLTENEKATFYLYSDGYQDQFGGEKGRKLLVKGFHQLLTNIYPFSMAEQKQALEKHLIAWKNTKNEQIDDILVLGVAM